ncbi:MAG: hypothetical protein ACI840_000299 [Ulvibacter sp.]|jgi:hypothetical protein
MQSKATTPKQYINDLPEDRKAVITRPLKHVPKKFDMGQSRMLFKYLQKTPFDLIGELVSKVSVKDWIEPYERLIKR